MNLKSLFLVGIGGAAGSMLRYAVSKLVLEYGPARAAMFPLATFGINIGGSFLIGLLFGFSLRDGNNLSYNLMLLLATGFCGGFTTFSAFALENVSLMQKGQSVAAIVYSVLSVACGLLVCRLGLWIAS